VNSTSRLRILLGILGAILALCVILAVTDVLPALERVRRNKEELKRIEEDIKRSLMEVRIHTDGPPGGDKREIPELPEIAAFITSMRRAQDKIGGISVAFDAVQTDRREIVLTAGADEELGEYVVSRLNVSFSSSLTEAAEFIQAIQSDFPDEDFDYLRLSSESADRDKVEVSMAIRLYGIPR